MKNKTLTVIAGLALALGSATAVHATTDENPTEVCTVTVDHDGWFEYVEVTPAYDEKVVTQEYVPGVPAVTKTVYVFQQKTTGKLREKDDPNWNPGKGWNLIGEKTVEVTPAVPEVPEESHTVHHPAVTEKVVHEPWSETVEVPCDEEPVVPTEPEAPVTETPDAPAAEAPAPTTTRRGGLPNTGA